MKTGSAALDCFEISNEDRKEIDDVLDAAVEQQAGRLPIYEFSIIGWMLSPSGTCSPGYTRYVAFRTTPPSDPRAAALVAAVKELERWRKERLDADVRRAA